MDDVDYRSVEDYGRDEETHQVNNTKLKLLTRFANHNIFYLLVSWFIKDKIIVVKFVYLVITDNVITEYYYAIFIVGYRKSIFGCF